MSDHGRRNGTVAGRGGEPTSTPPPAREEAHGVFDQSQFLTDTGGVEPVGPLWKVLDVIVLVCVAAMVVTVGLQVVSRSLGNAIPWTEELTRFLFIYSTFLGMAVGFRHAEHARIIFVVAKLPKIGQRIAVYLYLLAGVVFFVVVAVKGWELTVQQYDSGERSAVLSVGMYIATLPIVISAVLAIVALFQSLFRSPRLRDLIERGEMTSA